MCGKHRANVFEGGNSSAFLSGMHHRSALLDLGSVVVGPRREIKQTLHTIQFAQFCGQRKIVKMAHGVLTGTEKAQLAHILAQDRSVLIFTDYAVRMCINGAGACVGPKCECCKYV